MATLVAANGSTREVTPAKGSSFTLKELQTMVGGDVQMIDVPDGRKMFLHERGKYEALARNEGATVLVQRWLAFDDYIAGDVVLCSPREAGV
jgi:hypothetical protein